MQKLTTDLADLRLALRATSQVKAEKDETIAGLGEVIVADGAVISMNRLLAVRYSLETFEQAGDPFVIPREIVTALLKIPARTVTGEVKILLDDLGVHAYSNEDSVNFNVSVTAAAADLSRLNILHAFHDFPLAQVPEFKRRQPLVPEEYALQVRGDFAFNLTLLQPLMAYARTIRDPFIRFLRKSAASASHYRLGDAVDGLMMPATVQG